MDKKETIVFSVYQYAYGDKGFAGDSGYGFLCLKYKGDSALLSGYLCKSVFSTDEMIDAAIELLENISPESKSVYMPYHIEYVEVMGYMEYNGEE